MADDLASQPIKRGRPGDACRIRCNGCDCENQSIANLIAIMKRISICADEALLAQVKQASAREHKSVAQFMREALKSHVERQQPCTDRFSFIGKYESGRAEVAQKHERHLWSRKKLK